MRFSVNKQDAGYQVFQGLRSAGVLVDTFVDGEPVYDVFEADDLQNFVRHYVRDDKGALKKDGDSYVEETIRGKVEIRISPKPEPVTEPEQEEEKQPAAEPEPQPQPELAAAVEQEEQPVEADVDGK
jgi:hypothetical protein